MKKRRKKQKILIGLLLLFVVAQAIRPSKNTGSAEGPKDISTVVPVPDSVMAILKNSCYDCHSNHSDYPWYDQITPVNWWVQHHINEGKQDLNFTEFAAYAAKEQNHKLEEIAGSVEKGFMPLDSYLWMHGGAKLTEAQKKTVVGWANVSRKIITP